MAKCVHCGSRKGKRSCPALGGEICSACCGEHRRVTIACPEDCVWLAGGQLSSAPPPDATLSDRISALRTKLFDFATRHPRDARAVSDAYTTFGDFPIDRSSMPGLLSYAVYGHRDAEGLRGVDRFRAREGRRLRTDEVQVLSWLESAHFRLLEVREILTEGTFSAHDLLSEQELSVHDAHGLHEIAPSNFLAAWVIQIDGRYELEGTFAFLPREVLPPLLSEARSSLAAPDAGSHAMETLIPIILHEELSTPLEGTSDSLSPLRHSETFPDPSLAKADQPRSNPLAALDTPETRAFLAMFMQSKVDSWIDESQPALDGKTVRQAAADPATRDRAIELAKDYERKFARNLPQTAQVDFSGVWRDLGLSSE